MTRKMLTALMVVAALFMSMLTLGSFNDSAEAQGSPTCPYNLAEQVRIIRAAGNSDFTISTSFGTIPCAKAEAYPGPFTNMPTTPGGPYGWGTLNPVAGAAAPAAGGGGGTGGGLAHTGSESTVLGYVGTGLIAFGAVALGSRRKFFQGALED